MKTLAAVVYEMELPAPYAESRPIKIEELELEAPKEGEILVELTSAGLCHSDLSVLNGSRPRPMPLVLGHEAAGVVREVGPNVRDLKIDDHVIFIFCPTCGHCVPCATGRPVLCDSGQEANAQGTLLSGERRFTNKDGKKMNHHSGVSCFSQFTVAARESVVKVDSSLPMDKASLFGCAVITGAGAVFNRAAVEPGSSVAVFGLGGVGLSAVMAAKAAGATKIIAVDMLEHKFDLARKCGATHALNPADESFLEKIRDITGGGPQYAIEAVGSEAAQISAYNAICRGGTMVTVGLAHPDKDFSVPAVSLVALEKAVLGCYMGSIVPSVDVPKYVEMYRAGLLPVDLLFSGFITLEDVNASFDALARGDVIRQIIQFS